MARFEHSARMAEPQRQNPGLVAGFDRGAAGREVFTIRDLTKEFEVSARTLRFYEEKGLLAPRRDGEKQLYGRRDRARLRYVLMGKRVGFSLQEVREMLDLYDLGDGRRTQLQGALAQFQERTAGLRPPRRRNRPRTGRSAPGSPR